MNNRLDWRTARMISGVLSLLGLLILMMGCSDDDCLTCAEPAPIAPTMVYAVNGDQQVTVYWNDYPEYYSDRIVGYDVWRRHYEDGDENDPTRVFYFLAHVQVGENYNAARGQYHYIDDVDVQNAVDYEYAISSLTRHAESYLSFELVIATPLPMNSTPLTLFDVDGPNHHLAGFDFSLAAEHGAGPNNNGAEGIDDPSISGTTVDILVRFVDGVPMLESLRPGEVRVQDAGTFLDAAGQLYFEGVYWAPEFGYSVTGVLELIVGHIYVIEIAGEFSPTSLHYAKLGVTSINPDQGAVGIMWAYQLVNGLPVLIAPDDDQEKPCHDEFLLIRL